MRYCRWAVYITIEQTRTTHERITSILHRFALQVDISGRRVIKVKRRTPSTVCGSPRGARSNQREADDDPTHEMVPQLEALEL